jgi:RHS repeat-associated protein
MKYLYTYLLLFTTVCFSQQILNTKETTSRTVSDPRGIYLLSGFNAKATDVSPFIAKIGASSEPIVSGGTTNSTAGATNPSGEIAGSTSFHDTKGNIEVNGGGQLQFSLPIALPPGVKSVAPQMNLVYTSGTGNGIAGIGFSLTGITSINRVVKNIEKDGESKGVQLDYTDFYEFNGQRLLLKSGEYGKNGAEYVTEKFSTLKIKSVGAITGEAYSGPSNFEVTFDNGSQGWYGTTTDSRTPMEYNLVKWKDAQGNYITYNYTKTNNVSVISNVNWGGNETLAKPHFNSIAFNYDSNRAVKEVSYVHGVKFLQDKILSSIIVNANGNLFKKYVVEYVSDTNNTNYQYVGKITEYNAQNQAANPVTFGYETSSSTGWVAKAFTDNINNKIVGDFDGDGNVDYLKYHGSYIECLEYGVDYSTIGVGGAWGYQPNSNGTNVSIGPICLRSETRDAGLTLRKAFLSETIDQNINFVNPSPFTETEFNKAIAINFIDKDNQLSNKQGILITKTIPVVGSTKQDILLQVYAIENGVLTLKTSKTIPSAYDSSFSYLNISGNTTNQSETSTYYNRTSEMDIDGKGVSDAIVTLRKIHNSKIFNNITNEIYSSSYSDTESNLMIDLNPATPIEESVVVANLAGGLKGDFNGDGKIDFMSFDSGGNPYMSKLYRSKVSKEVSYTQNPFYIGAPQTIKGLRDKAVLGDFNGDKKTDLLVPSAVGSSDWYLYVSTGTSFKEEYKSGLLDYKPFEDYKFESNWAVDYYAARKQTYQALDLDKDGKSELIGFNYYTQEHIEPGYDHRDYSNTSIAIFKNAGANSTTDVNFFQAYYHTFDFALFDFNESVGDYKINQINNSILLVGAKRRDKSQGLLFSFNLYDTSKTSRINKITQGNVPTIIEYKELKKDYTFYDTEKKEKYPFVELENISNSFAVSQLSQLDRKQDFKYRGLIANVNGRGIIGFRKTARSNWYATGFENTKLWSGQEIDPLQNGVVIKQWSVKADLYEYPISTFPDNISQNSTQLLSFKSFSYKKEKLTTGVEVILPDISTEKDFLKNITKTETITYGNYYLPTQVVTSINNGFATTTSNTVYDSNATGVGNAYYIGRITEKEEIASAYGDTKKAKTKYTYQNNLPETVKTFNQDETEFALETYVNDSFGNTTEKTVTNSKDTQTQNNKIEFDSKGRFAIKSTNNLGLITQSTYNDWGQLLTQIDPLGNTITNTYDSWGKPLTVKNNLTGTTTYTYKKEGDDIVTIQYSPTGDTKETRTNKNGQQYLVKTKGFETGTYIAKQVVYDAVGRKIKESEPYFAMGAIKWNTIAYDDSQFPAKVTVTGFNGKIVETQILDKTTTIKELNGYSRITKKTTDVLGNVVESEDKGGVIKFTFNAQGQNITATYGQNIVTTTYDSWGRKASFNDPSNGLYQYDYDGFGKLKKETSPKGTKEFIFNTLGQLITQKELSTDDGGANTNKTITYTYDAKGLIISKTGTANGKDYNSSITYDANGRITSAKENSNNRFFFKKNITYDDKGRVTSYEKGLYSSGGLTKTNIENLYSIWGGDLYQVKDKSTAKVLWELQKAKANGQILNAKLGGVAIQNVYDNNDFLSSVSHSSALQPNVLKMTYAFNAIKNELNSRSRTGIIAVNEVFNYDDNNRLISWTNPKTNLLSTNGYDDKGRILENDQVGTIGFKTDKIYQANVATLNSQGEQNYLNNIKQIITYNENNDPVYIDGEKGDVLFSYGLTDMRQMTTYGGNFDSDKKGKFTKYYSEDGSNEIIVDNTTGLEKHIIYIGGSPYDSNIIYVKNYVDTTAKYLFLHKDYLGSILAISDENGNSVEQRHFDAWGMLTHGEMKILDRGYTSHEHFDEVGIIHMNGRLYDPLLRRFLNADENIQEPYNTQNYNKYGYVMNNPLLFNDPNGEEAITLAAIGVAALIGAAIAVTTYTIGLLLNNRLDQFNAGQALKSAFWGAISGAVTYGIGSVFAAGGAAANALGSATFLVQAAAHGVAQGALSYLQGGDFWQGAAGGFFGSLGASAWSVAAPNWSQSAVGTIAFGAIAGGVGAELTGGNFWQGAITGGIVSGLNHAMHKIDQRRELLSRFKKGSSVKPFGKPDFSQQGISDLNGAVDGLGSDFVKSGSPEVSFDLIGKDTAHTTDGHVYINPSKITTNYKYASILFHEYRHAYQYFAPYLGSSSRVEHWKGLYGNDYLGEGGYRDAMEYDAYSHQYRMGDSSSYVNEGVGLYYNRMVMKWNKARN